MSTDPIIERIRKLLRMQRGGTPEEIASALAKARDLASKHGIDLNSVDPNVETQGQRFTREDQIMGTRIPLEARHAANLVLNYFKVEPVISEALRNGRWVALIVFCGTPWDIEVAKYVFTFLRRHFRRSWERRENRRLKDRAAFYWGMYVGIGAILRKSEPAADPLALVVANQLKAYVAQEFPRTQKTGIDKGDSDNAWRNGFVVGVNTQINSAIEGGGAKPLLLTAG
ncbi:MAG TPA: DUF2786 domain-containing protein [Candidatus Limnocylindria bacterium]|jgi:hypothetical protein|nr:DUF2786 domain-containing protein [Candidatus Limnocylindria bacterium]